jgi:hypothetical protein
MKTHVESMLPKLVVLRKLAITKELFDVNHILTTWEEAVWAI